jgi:act minimal PKS chain-length factor (CLF/KS beta)
VAVAPLVPPARDDPVARGEQFVDVEVGTREAGLADGPLDVVAALLAIRDGELPPAAGIDVTDPAYRLDLVTTAPRPWPGRTALVLARGTGGFHSALVVSAADC